MVLLIALIYYSAIWLISKKVATKIDKKRMDIENRHLTDNKFSPSLRAAANPVLRAILHIFAEYNAQFKNNREDEGILKEIKC